MKTYSILKTQQNNKIVVAFKQVTEEELSILKQELKEAHRLFQQKIFRDPWRESEFRGYPYGQLQILSDYGPILILEEINISE